MQPLLSQFLEINSSSLNINIDSNVFKKELFCCKIISVDLNECCRLDFENILLNSRGKSYHKKRTNHTGKYYTQHDPGMIDGFLAHLSRKCSW